MRIRKRLPTPSLLGLAPMESLHHQQPPTDPPTQVFPPPLPVPAPPRADLQLTIVKGTEGWICKIDDDCMHSNSSTQLGEEALPNKNKIGKISTATTVLANKDNSSGAKDSEGISSFASALGEKWCNAVTAKTNTEAVEEDSRDMNHMMKKKKRKVDKESVMTDGSRCSRVNGRGWRCSRPTIVGYSLCAHHSINGRLKSKEEKQLKHTAESLTMLKKRNKIGMLNNRSISHLLAQTESQSASPMPILDPTPSCDVDDTRSLLLVGE